MKVKVNSHRISKANFTVKVWCERHHPSLRPKGCSIAADQNDKKVDDAA